MRVRVGGEPSEYAAANVECGDGRPWLDVMCDAI